MNNNIMVRPHQVTAVLAAIDDLRKDGNSIHMSHSPLNNESIEFTIEHSDAQLLAQIFMKVGYKLGFEQFNTNTPEGVEYKKTVLVAPAGLCLARELREQHGIYLIEFKIVKCVGNVYYDSKLNRVWSSSNVVFTPNVLVDLAALCKAIDERDNNG